MSFTLTPSPPRKDGVVFYRPFHLPSGWTVSIQQSHTHYCDEATDSYEVAVWLSRSVKNVAYKVLSGGVFDGMTHTGDGDPLLAAVLDMAVFGWVSRARVDKLLSDLS